MLKKLKWLKGGGKLYNKLICSTFNSDGFETHRYNTRSNSPLGHDY